MEEARSSPDFASFWMGGFESSTHINKYGKRLDLLAVTQHDRWAAQDYGLMKAAGLSVVRDAARWHLIEQQRSVYDFSSFVPLLDAAKLHDMQVIWDICHYGFPDDVDLLSPDFVGRFTDYAVAFATFIKNHSDDVPFYCPFNEISFFSWAAGEAGWIHPFLRGRGGEVKRQLVRACIHATDAIWKIDSRARFVYVDPIIHVHPPRAHPDLAEAARLHTESQYEALDMFMGRTAPELGGHPRYLDIIGVNFYHSNQWEYGGERLRWEDNPRDTRWIPLHQMLEEMHKRYGRPLFIAETSHVGVGRGEWITEIADEVCVALKKGVPILGVCLYPIIDRPDWEDETHWHNSGLWDFKRQGDTFVRVINDDYAQAFRAAQWKVQQCLIESRRTL